MGVVAGGAEEIYKQKIDMEKFCELLRVTEAVFYKM